MSVNDETVKVAGQTTDARTLLPDGVADPCHEMIVEQT
jgi:hypothetical protein